MNFCLGELFLKLLARIGEWHQNLSEKTVHIPARHWLDSKPGAIHAAAHSVRSGRPDALPTELINDVYMLKGLAFLNGSIGCVSVREP